MVRGWGAYFRTGNASRQFQHLDEYVERRLQKLLIIRAGAQLRRGQAPRWRRPFFEALGLYRLCGTIAIRGSRNAAT